MKLKIIRTRLELSQNELAKLCDVPQWKISIYESGDVIPSLSDAQKIANILHIDFTILWPELKKKETKEKGTDAIS